MWYLRHGVAFLRGIDTRSLRAQGEQRRSVYFNIDRDIPMAIRRMGGAQRYPSSDLALLPTFAEPISMLRDIAGPILGINAEFHHPMK